jgi:hypothetical protein
MIRIKIPLMFQPQHQGIPNGQTHAASDQQ